MKDAYYFPHFYNAQHDPKISMVRLEFGWEGYGIFFAILEKLRSCTNYKWSSQAKAGLQASLSDASTPLETVIKVYDKLVIEKLIIEDENWIYSAKLIEFMKEKDDRIQRLRDAGAKGGKSRSLAQAMLKPSSSNPQARKERKQKGNISIVGEKKIVFFIEHLKNESFLKTFNEFLEMRNKINKPATQKAQELVLKVLEKVSLETAVLMLNQSIVNNWRDVYPLNQNKLPTQKALSNYDQSKELFKTMDKWENEQT